MLVDNLCKILCCCFFISFCFMTTNKKKELKAQLWWHIIPNVVLISQKWLHINVNENYWHFVGLLVCWFNWIVQWDCVTDHRTLTVPFIYNTTTIFLVQFTQTNFLNFLHSVFFLFFSFSLLTIPFTKLKSINIYVLFIVIFLVSSFLMFSIFFFVVINKISMP